VKYDAAIVGAGPAGSVLAYLLASQGVSVLLLEKERLPRYKPCAGGLTKRTLQCLPFHASEIIEDSTYKIEAFLNKEKVFELSGEHPILWMVMRDKFDHFLVQKALDADVTLREGTHFISLEGGIGSLTLETSAGRFASRFVIGADGVNSKVARALGFTVERRLMCALEGEVYLSDLALLNTFAGCAHFDFGVVPKGYAWIFPKRDHLSVGVLTVFNEARSLRKSFAAYLEAKGLSESGKIKKLKAHLIPYKPNKNNTLGSQKGMLVGDAAGYTDPIMGEGIYFAIKEAWLAARVFVQALNEGFQVAGEYSQVLRDEFFDDISNAGKLAYFLYHFPLLSHPILKAYGKRLAAYHLAVTRDEKRYADFGRALLS